MQPVARVNSMLSNDTLGVHTHPSSFRCTIHDKSVTVQILLENYVFWGPSFLRHFLQKVCAYALIPMLAAVLVDSTGVSQRLSVLP